MRINPAGGATTGRARRVWSIGIQVGPSPFELTPITGNPVLTAADVSGRDARFVADPFMLWLRRNMAHVLRGAAAGIKPWRYCHGEEPERFELAF
jgi:hypothetical protein